MFAFSFRRLRVALAALMACLIIALAEGPRAFAQDSGHHAGPLLFDECITGHYANGSGPAPFCRDGAPCGSCRTARPRLNLDESEDYYRQRYDTCMANHFGAGREESETDFCAQWAPCSYCRPAPPPPRRTGPCAEILYYPEDGVFYPVPNTAIYMQQVVETGDQAWQVQQKRLQVIDWFRHHLSGWSYFETDPVKTLRRWWFEKHSGSDSCKIEIGDTWPVTVIYGPYPSDQVPPYHSPIPH